jgi:hypothetical protein
MCKIKYPRKSKTHKIKSLFQLLSLGSTHFSFVSPSHAGYRHFCDKVHQNANISYLQQQKYTLFFHHSFSFSILSCLKKAIWKIVFKVKQYNDVKKITLVTDNSPPFCPQFHYLDLSCDDTCHPQQQDIKHQKLVTDLQQQLAQQQRQLEQKQLKIEQQQIQIE